MNIRNNKNGITMIEIVFWTSIIGVVIGIFLPEQKIDNKILLKLIFKKISLILKIK